PGRDRLPSQGPGFGPGCERRRLGREQTQRLLTEEAGAVATRPAAEHELGESCHVRRRGEQPGVARHASEFERAPVIHGAGSGMSARSPDVCVRSWRTVIPAVADPLSSAMYAETGSSRRTCPRSMSSISEVVVAMTLVSDARS